MSKQREEPVEATIVIQRYTDKSKPFNVLMKGDWSARQLMAIHPMLVKENRRRIRQIIEQTKPQPQQSEGA